LEDNSGKRTLEARPKDLGRDSIGCRGYDSLEAESLWPIL